jgi:hypothetical protein
MEDWKIMAENYCNGLELTQWLITLQPSMPSPSCTNGISVLRKHHTAVVCSHTFKHVDLQIEVSIVLQSQNIIIGMSMMLEEVVFNSDIVVTSF